MGMRPEGKEKQTHPSGNPPYLGMAGGAHCHRGNFGGVKMMHAGLIEWLNEHLAGNTVLYLKRLSANDTQANGAHQAGPYLPRGFVFRIFPSVNRPQGNNPDRLFNLHIDSHMDARNARVVWYNQATRNETRITRLGGQASALLDPESTGALAVFSFPGGLDHENNECHVWVCDHETEADLVEDRVGYVEPGQGRIWAANENQRLLIPPPEADQECRVDEADIPPEWLQQFPRGQDLVRMAVERRPLPGVPVDSRLIPRRECEFQIFKSVENATVLPQLRAGFNSVDEFVELAKSVMNRRYPRAGRSLEYHVMELFLEENLVAGQHFQYQPESEPGKKPDFLFPNQAAYRNALLPDDRLMMLACKTTTRERWRQILDEADRINRKHLLTLDRGLSENQVNHFRESGIQLVVPAPLIGNYPAGIRQHLQTLESFIADVRLLDAD